MTIFIEEYAGMAPSNRPERFQGVPMLPPNAVTQVSSGGAVSTIAIAANTTFISILNSAAAAFLIVGGSSTASTAAGSTVTLPQNVLLLRGIRPSTKLFAWST